MGDAETQTAVASQAGSDSPRKGDTLSVRTPIGRTSAQTPLWCNRQIDEKAFGRAFDGDAQKLAALQDVDPCSVT